MLARDGVTGEVLEARYTMGLGAGGASLSGPTYQYDVTVPAHSVRQVALDYLLVACSYGNVTHSARLSGDVKRPSAESSGDASSVDTSSEPASASEPSEPSEPASEPSAVPVWAIVLLAAVLLASVCAACLVLCRKA